MQIQYLRVPPFGEFSPAAIEARIRGFATHSLRKGAAFDMDPLMTHQAAGGCRGAAGNA